MLNLEQQRKHAKDLRRAHKAGSLDAAVRIVRHLARARGVSDPHAILARRSPWAKPSSLLAAPA